MSAAMEPWDVEGLRRSLAMLRPGATSFLNREEAIQILEELQRVQGRLDQLKAELRRLAES